MDLRIVDQTISSTNQNFIEPAEETSRSFTVDHVIHSIIPLEINSRNIEMQF